METTNHFKKQKHWFGFRRLLLIVVCMAASATLAWAGPITLNAKNRVLKEVLQEIEKQSDLSFIYSSSTINVNQKVTFNCKDVPVEVALKQLLEKEKIDFTIEGKQVLLSPSKTNAATPSKTNSKTGGNQNKTVKGKVVDEKGVGVPGATVTVRGTSIGTATNIDGEFSINVPSSSSVVAVSFIGYSMMEQKVDSYQEGARMQFDLKPESKRIDEVIVTGYQTISKERATGSYVVLSPKTLEGKLQTNILDRLEGQVAGLSTYKGNTVIRGTSTINAETKILYVVDGIPYEGDINAINPSDVVNVTILKDATAASIYGARSSNGVIVITTKSGYVGKTAVSYSGSIKFQGLPDRDYQNMMNSSEFVDFQKELFDLYPVGRLVQRRWQNDVQVLLLNHKDGIISDSDLEKGLNYYKGQDRYSEVKKELLRSNKVTHQHNLSFGGGSEFHKYNISVNYLQDLPYEKEQSTDRLGFNLKNTFNFFKWMKADVGVLGSNVKSDYDNGILGMSILNRGMASYYTLRDENGNPKQWYNAKSQFEIDRLKGLGLLDETYVPLNEMRTAHYNAKSNYLNLNFGVTLKLIDGLTADLRYQNENTNSYKKQYYTKDAYRVKTMVNDATQIDPTTKAVTYNIPQGGQMMKDLYNSSSYTLRAQLNYSKIFNNLHDLQAILGAERRRVVDNYEFIHKLGYDDQMLSDSPINEALLDKQLTGTEALDAKFDYTSIWSKPTVTELENRYLSYYANASYTYNRKITATGSIRLDQSNLFGTDFKKQLKPLWSVGLHYVILENKLTWLDRLVGRVTYGINGNIAKKNYPFTTIVDYSYSNGISGGKQSSISSPPNPMLRWEKTKVTNAAIDFAVLKNRLSGSVEYYYKKSTDLLGERSMDPTLGWSSVLMNFGSMYNRGVEVTLSSTNIKGRDFTWATNFIFGYNKNEITEVTPGGESAMDYYTDLNNRKGYPMGALFSVRYNGLDENGIPTALKQDGTVVKKYSELSKDDLVYSGTYNPPYNASLSNRFTYKGFDFSFMFIYFGGHVMRDIRAGMLLSNDPSYYTSNMDKDFLNFWRKSGDELNPDVNPRLVFDNSAAKTATYLWSAADKHIVKGDYIKLRDLTLGYTVPSVYLKKFMVQSVRVNLQAQNVWKWVANDSGLDPEVWDGSTPTPIRGQILPATYTIGLSINF